MGPAEELVRIAKKLDKMVARKSTEGALDLLKSLTGYTMTIQLLQTTRIGVAVNSVRKHCSDEEVVASAKILIKNWKRLLSSTAPKKEKDTEGEKEKKEKKEKGLDLPSCPNEGAKPPKSPAEKHKEKHKERGSSDSRSPTASSKKSPPDGKKERRDSADSRSSTASSSSSPQKRVSGER
ncbi:PREDICTED: transcription elongation factor A protein 3-like [Mesitornis unicolor]|uniref:transcription elongation factor A protein 3-like n=1 Tax=Mesitornis unicolor TaxID=54374 RepID=UPI00052911DC|nr:PREDICTED: transcription elongation factor A protein 3-like [Mesitornis unicolor]